MNQQHLTGEIIRLREEKNILILAHYYTLPGVQEVAHFVGDSLELCRRAFLWKGDTIFFAGVDFMGESEKVIVSGKAGTYSGRRCQLPHGPYGLHI